MPSRFIPLLTSVEDFQRALTIRRLAAALNNELVAGLRTGMLQGKYQDDADTLAVIVICMQSAAARWDSLRDAPPPDPLTPEQEQALEQAYFYVGSQP